MNPPVLPGIDPEASNEVSSSVATSNTATAQLPAFPLLHLAPELRQRIFECFFENYRVAVQCCDPNMSDAHYVTDDEFDDFDEHYGETSRLALTRTSKQIRYESLDAFLRTAIFDFQLLDQQPKWVPDEHLRSYIVRMRNFFGPPRLLHHLRYTTLSYYTNSGEKSRWVDECTADHVVCDMIVDDFDIMDAMTIDDSNEAQYFRGLKNAIAGPQGAKLTLCVQVEDKEPTWNAWDEPHIRSGFQVWKQKVIVRRKPKTEQGKRKLRNTLMLMGLELMGKDKKIIEPAKKDHVDDNNNMEVGGANDIDASGNDDHIGIMDDEDMAATGIHTSETLHAGSADDTAYQWWSGARED